MTDTPAHTPLPWSVCPSFPADIQADGTEIASCFEEKHIGQTWTIEGPITVSYGEHKANAAFIILACNSHYLLVESLREAVAQYGKQGGPWNVPSDPGGWIARARAALSQAGGASE